MMNQRKEEEKQESQGTLLQGSGLGKSRIEALADGIFAVAMTLLVFNVHLPPFGSTDNLSAILGKLFVEQGAVLVAYGMSFAQLGVYWVSHQAQFQYIRRTDRYLLWINILFLLLISFIPFTTQLLGANWYNSANYSVSRVVLITYGIHLILIAGVVFLHWGYATHRHRLTDLDLSSHLIQMAARRILASPIICVVAIILAFINPVASMICYLLIPVYYILPGRVDWHWTVSHRERPANNP